MKTVLDKLVHENQKGFIAGRYIGENTRLLYDMLHYLEGNNIPGLLMLIDFEKAFDSVSWEFIFNVLNFFNFGDYFIGWIRTMFNDIKLCVIQNGFFTDFFNIGRGCRQGDPIAPYLFILCAEILGIMIRNSKLVKGISIKNKEYLISQYADDTAILLDGTESSVRNTLSLIFQFSKFSGLRPNYDKTKCIWIGSKRFSTEKWCKEYNLSWTSEPFTVLGITFSLHLEEIIELNYRHKIEEMKKLVNSWSKRKLTTLGRITVVKSILISKITHLFISLPNPSNNVLNELETLFFNYIWDSKTDRISRKSIIQDYHDGGLRMINVKSFIKSLKLTWIRRLLLYDSSWNKLFFDIMPDIFKHFTEFGSSFIKKMVSKTNNPFWKDVFISLNDYMNVQPDEFILSPLWFNDLIQIEKKSVFLNTGLIEESE